MAACSLFPQRAGSVTATVLNLLTYSHFAFKLPAFVGKQTKAECQEHTEHKKIKQTNERNIIPLKGRRRALNYRPIVIEYFCSKSCRAALSIRFYRVTPY